MRDRRRAAGIGRRGGVARCGSGRTEVGGVVVAVDTAIAGAERRQRRTRSGCRSGTLKSRAGAEANQIDDLRVARTRGRLAGQCGGDIGQREIAVRATRAKACRGLIRRHRHGRAIGTRTELNQEIAVRADRARQVHPAGPVGACGTRILHRHAGERDGAASGVEQLDVLGVEGSASIAAAAINLADAHMGRSRHRLEVGDNRAVGRNRTRGVVVARERARRAVTADVVDLVAGVGRQREGGGGSIDHRLRRVRRDRARRRANAGGHGVGDGWQRAVTLV